MPNMMDSDDEFFDDTFEDVPEPERELAADSPQRNSTANRRVSLPEDPQTRCDLVEQALDYMDRLGLDLAIVLAKVWAPQVYAMCFIDNHETNRFVELGICEQSVESDVPDAHLRACENDAILATKQLLKHVYSTHKWKD
jgi:hypothetical protein